MFTRITVRLPPPPFFFLRTDFKYEFAFAEGPEVSGDRMDVLVGVSGTDAEHPSVMAVNSLLEKVEADLTLPGTRRWWLCGCVGTPPSILRLYWSGSQTRANPSSPLLCLRR